MARGYPMEHSMYGSEIPQSFPIPLSYDPSCCRAIAKRAFDILAAVTALVLLSPFLVCIAMLVCVSGKGPIFFMQKRVGAGGKIFNIYKFRTMIPDAEDVLKDLKDQNEASGPVFKIRRDPRTTPIGRYLRRYSLDELPQLWNIIRGEMSIVGPRPPIPSEVAMYHPWQLRRLSVPQGLTCIWQISGRSDVTFDDWVKLDLRYIDTWSLRLDFAIIARTFLVVLRGSGAY